MTGIPAVRFLIDDKDSVDFTNAEIQHFLDEVNNVDYAVYNLAFVLIAKLRKQLLEGDTTSEEETKLADLKKRLDVLLSIYEEYKAKYEASLNNTSGRMIATVKPTIAGNDI